MVGGGRGKDENKAKLSPASAGTWAELGNMHKIYRLYVLDLPETCQKYSFDTYDICLRYLLNLKYDGDLPDFSLKNA